MKVEAILLLYIRTTSQSQRQALPQNKGLGKYFPIRFIRQAGIAILISNKIAFKVKSIKRKEEDALHS